MKKNKLNKIFSALIIFILGICLLVQLPACRILNEKIIALNRIVSQTTSSLANDGNSESTKQESNTESDTANREATSTSKQESIVFNIEEYIPDYIQAVIKNNIKKAAGASIDIEFEKVANLKENDPGNIKIYFKNRSQAGGIEVIGNYVLALAGNFYTYCDDIKSEDFLRFWNGDSDSLDYLANDGTSPVMVFEKNIFNILENVFGECKISNPEIIDDPDKIKALISGSSHYFTLIPFEEISREFKILNVDGISIFDKDTSIAGYPFSMNILLDAGDGSKTAFLKDRLKEEDISNRKAEKLAVLNMTGCTALVRGTADRMESKGVLYPGLKIADILKDADITHISNEITFVEGNPRDREDEIVFSSDPKYIELLKFVGADVIELTGNHMNDYGPGWMVYTLEMYEKEGWQYFAGGRNLAESYRPALFEVNGNKIAFLGCNQFGPESYWATEDKAGAAPPDYDDFEAIIKKLKDEGYAVIFTFQHSEVYDYLPSAGQVKDFRRMAAAGADIVSGSQAHHPQAIEFYGGGTVFYGLGNLFFDQMYNKEVRQGMIAKHIFYEGRYINTVIITTMLEDYCQPRITDLAERYDILSHVFEAGIIQGRKK